jgi:hypothetical protein
MPRDGTQTYILPFPDVVADTTIESPVYNGFTNDVAQDLNAPRPITSGGTGATSAAGALAALGGETASQVVTNYDSYVFKPGSFYSAAGATGAPTANAFSGICYLSDASNIVIEARDSTTGIKHVRRKVAGVWGAFAIDASASFVELAGDTMTGLLVLSGDPVAALGAATKQTVDLKANIASPIFTGDPQAPTPTVGDSDTSIATTAFVQAAIANLIETVKAQKFTSSGTYTPSAGMLYCIIECVGAGGGGGGAAGSATVCTGGGGGGGGGYARLIASAATIGASKAVTIGTGGTAAPTGANAGSAGGDTSVGSLCIGKGGGGGNGGSTVTIGQPGIGGVAGTGDFTIQGSNGRSAFFSTSSSNVFFAGGDGGSSHFGAGGISNAIGASFTNGTAGLLFGGGGSGGMIYQTASTVAGGTGAQGVVFITEYCSQ